MIEDFHSEFYIVDFFGDQRNGTYFNVFSSILHISCVILTNYIRVRAEYSIRSDKIIY